MQSISVEIDQAPVSPAWHQANLAAGASPKEPALLVTEQSIILYFLEYASGDLTPTFAVRDRQSDDSEPWTTYQDVPPLRGFPSLGMLHPPELAEHNGIIYLRGYGGFKPGEFLKGEFVACTRKPLPGSLSDWESSTTMKSSQTDGPGGAGAPSRLGFIGDLPILIGTTISSGDSAGLPGFIFLSNYAAVADSAFPTEDDDWEVIALPGFIDGEVTGSSKIGPLNLARFGLVATSLPDGAFCFAQTSSSDQLDYYYVPDESAVRSNSWARQRLGDTTADKPLERGIPSSMLSHGQQIYLSYFPANPDDRNSPPTDRGLGLAISNDPTGLSADWTMQHVPNLSPIHAFKGSPTVLTNMQFWGDRLVLLVVDDGNVTVARALQHGAPLTGEWATQRIADSVQLGEPRDVNDLLYAATATHGLDFFVLYARDAFGLNGADSPLFLATAEGSW